VFGDSVGAIGVSDMVFPSGNEPKTNFLGARWKWGL
jgi:hypothetical protein